MNRELACNLTCVNEDYEVMPAIEKNVDRNILVSTQ